MNDIQMSEIELIPDGKNIKVTNENKVQYIELVNCYYAVV